ncbi:ATP-binding protein [Thiolapillus sp.]|uniref:ATP-binding protein n=1 Tax=Thiolapillus sp. TaxID=2017437 RepID=UPI0025F6C638
MRFPNTLFARTSLTISGALLIFILFTGFVVLNYMLLPVARQSAGDLAALMVLSARTWTELLASARKDFQKELRSSHDLILQATPPEAPLKALLLHSPYMLFLEEALSTRLGQTLHIHQSDETPDLYWAILPIAGKTLYLGINHDHIGAEPPRAVVSIFLGASLFILLTTLLVVRRITRPLETQSRGVQRLGQGAHSLPLPEDGPRELADLARKFNQLSSEIERLLENRTTLLGGISHDLRTPLARLRIAAELLRGREDDDLLDSMQQDMEEMDTLITRTLELARMMQQDGLQDKETDLAVLVAEIGAARTEAGRQLHIEAASSCKAVINKLVLRRILNNLLDNAFHYAGEKPVGLHLHCSGSKAQICVLDQGAGIPDDQLGRVLQPFYRLDPSRNRGTGGSGLGLAIVQQLAQLQGWKITLNNRKAGGLSACVEIPRDQPGQQQS